MATAWNVGLCVFALAACDVSPEDPYSGPKNAIVGDILCEEASLHSSFTWIERNIIAPNCVATLCHNSDSPLEDLDLNIGLAYAGLLTNESEYSELPLVDPGRPANSYLMISMGMFDQELLETRPMPLTTKVCQPMLDTIVRWIEAGASDD